MSPQEAQRLKLQTVSGEEIRAQQTAQGFIGNFAAAGQKSLDRTEPMIGAKVLLEIYKKHKVS